MGIVLLTVIVHGPDLGSQQSRALLALWVLVLIAAAVGLTRGALLIPVAIGGGLVSLSFEFPELLGWSSLDGLNGASQLFVVASLVAALVALVLAIREFLSRPRAVDIVLPVCAIVAFGVFASSAKPPVLGVLGHPGSAGFFVTTPQPGPIFFGQSVDPKTFAISGQASTFGSDQQIAAVAHLSRKSIEENLHVTVCQSASGGGCHTVGTLALNKVPGGQRR